MAEQILHRLRTRDDMEMWVAEHDGQIVSAGRLEPVDGTEFAGIWGGATRPEYRGRGIYRALTSARARSAIGHGKRYINSDSTEFSRPILERSGFLKVSTTTPYEWRRAPELLAALGHVPVTAPATAGARHTTECPPWTWPCCDG